MGKKNEIRRVSDLKTDYEIEDIGQALMSLDNPIEIALPETNEALAQQIAVKIGRDAKNTAETAFELAALKARAGHGNYLPLLERYGVHQRTANRYLQLAHFLLAIPQEHRPRFIGTAVTKLPALTKLEPEDLAAAADSGKLDEWLAMPKVELVEHVKKLKQGEVKLKHELEVAQDKHEKLKAQLDRRHDHLRMPAFAAEVREEAAALTEKMLISLESLNELIQSHLLGAREEPEAERFQRSAAGTLFHALRGAVSRGQELLEILDGHFGEEVTAGLKFDHQLTKAESAHYLKVRAALLEQTSKESHNRSVVREATAETLTGKRGRGRPRQVKK